jgi:hypothetical protein
MRKLCAAFVPAAHEWLNSRIIKDKRGICTTQRETLWGDTGAFQGGKFVRCQQTVRAAKEQITNKKFDYGTTEAPRWSVSLLLPLRRPRTPGFWGGCRGFVQLRLMLLLSRSLMRLAR